MTDKQSKLNITYCDNFAIVSCGNVDLGRILFESNSFHEGNRYLTLELIDYNHVYAREIFETLHHKCGKNLQVMLSSSETKITNFLISAGFKRRRRCFEVEATQNRSPISIPSISLYTSTKGEELYMIACEIMYQRYIESHKAISPWTGSYNDFLSVMPETIVCDNADFPNNFAFIEDNEIAYVCGNSADSFRLFAENILAHMFEEHETVFFEADDCDEYAMLLKTLVGNTAEESYDTYIFSR